MFYPKILSVPGTKYPGSSK